MKRGTGLLNVLRRFRHRHGELCHGDNASHSTGVLPYRQTANI